MNRAALHGTCIVMPLFGLVSLGILVIVVDSFG